MLTEGWRDASLRIQMELCKVNMALPVAEQAEGE